VKKKGKLTLADIAHVSPGTPAGNWFRRYWLVISRVEDLKDIPLALKILGEDLVLFRDPNGQMGLLGLHCPHRGTSLEYGDIEEKGIRCPYHGWLFDVSGQCLEQPAEPPESTFCRKVQHLSYPVAAIGGLVFAYLGPNRNDPPSLPRYSSLVRQDGCRAIFPPRYYDYNWFNFFENLPDIMHACTLHTSGTGHANRTWGDSFFSPNDMPRYEAVETDYGVKVVTYKPAPTPGTSYVHILSTALPSVAQLPGRTADEGDYERTLFITPSDDSHFVVFNCDFHSGNDSNFLLERQKVRAAEPSTQERKAHDQRPLAPFRGQVWKEDIVCQSSQGTIGYRQSERLADSDRGVILLRKTVLKSMEQARSGEMPNVSKTNEQDILKFDSFIGTMTGTELRSQISRACVLSSHVR
jgi:phenylpropionate dioxygenase-like ring-hydroxylating dioxygenase large terminal subunit